VPEPNPIRVLSIAHTAISRPVGRMRYYPLTQRGDLDIHLVAPARWHQYGRTLFADPPDDSGLKVHILPIRLARGGPMSWYLHFYVGLRALIAQIKPDVVHLWEEPWSIVALQATLIKGPARLIMEVDQNILKRLPPPFESIRRHVLKNTAHVLSRSPEATSVVRARGYAGPVSLIGYGVDEQTFRPRSGWPANQREDRPLTIGYVGRIVEEKGIQDALEAIAQTRSPIRLAIMGEGPYEQQLRERAHELGVADRVLINGWGSPTEVATFLQSLDVLLLLTRKSGSTNEQFGRVIVEGQSCGIPVIGSTCGAIPNVVGEGGWIIPERSPRGLAKILDGLAENPQALVDKAQAAQKNVAERFTFPIVARELADAWIKAAAISPAKPPSG
jgi:glycosyltransferase involved in cell wall biosynthesis